MWTPIGAFGDDRVAARMPRVRQPEDHQVAFDRCGADSKRCFGRFVGEAVRLLREPLRMPPTRLSGVPILPVMRCVLEWSVSGDPLGRGYFRAVRVGPAGTTPKIDTIFGPCVY